MRTPFSLGVKTRSLAEFALSTIGDGILIIFHVEVFLGTFATKKSRRTFCLSLTFDFERVEHQHCKTLHAPLEATVLSFVVTNRVRARHHGKESQN